MVFIYLGLELNLTVRQMWRGRGRIPDVSIDMGECEELESGRMETQNLIQSCCRLTAGRVDGVQDTVPQRGSAFQIQRVKISTERSHGDRTRNTRT